MSSITTTMQDTSVALAVRSQNFLTDTFEATKSRLVRQEGQTAAEYMGILLIVAIIIGALFASGIGKQITTAVKEQITNISTGKKP